jgi:hypothetical protein
MTRYSDEAMRGMFERMKRDQEQRQKRLRLLHTRCEELKANTMISNK